MQNPVIATPEVTNHILQRFKLRADKKLGQNFLVDPAVVQGIVEAAELSPSDTVLEVGPGIGTLTQGLAESGADVVAVELDRRLLPVLDTTLAGYNNVTVVNEDILQADIKKLSGGKCFKVCANLPYYITTPIIFALLEQRLPIDRLVVMVQKEVAQRITAKPGGKDYGALSVAMQYYTDPELVFIVPPASFIPQPSVDSAVIVCRKRQEPPVIVKDEEVFFRVVKAAFSLRRKMLSNSLKNMGIDAAKCQQWLEAAGVDGRRRAETLSLEEFAALTNAFVANDQSLQKL
ncbi:MAG: 16S rRNA (adenine(1518)-N(6)/adenine(1519)-N(6))-dimethyltransferase RsmA [Acidaminococcaceae bacterium]|nr:16S rRNA (adenine(1518)-N(6)/adenine(1519)-N(6))-dimethyltransferase RsmA [Acidaminococcaceae bacterium]